MSDNYLKAKLKTRIEVITSQLTELQKTAEQYTKAINDMKQSFVELTGEAKGLVNLLKELEELEEVEKLPIKPFSDENDFGTKDDETL